MKIYWVGTRKSDIKNVRDIDFYGSVTIFGDGKDNNYAYCLNENQNRVNHNVPDKKEDQFFYDTIVSLIRQDDNVRFYFYNPQCVYYIEGLKAYKKYFLAINDEAIMRETVSKKLFYDELKGQVAQVRKESLNRNNCDYSDLLRIFDCNPEDNPKFIFQAPVSSGGNGTFLVEKETVDAVKNLLSSNSEDKYLVSVYREKNIPINIHAIIFSSKIVLTPGSIQIMKQDDHRLLYRGADFPAYTAYKKAHPAMIEAFEAQARKVCEYYQKKGFRGICGIDAIIVKDIKNDTEQKNDVDVDEAYDETHKVYILEINNRFQASTGLIDLAIDDCPDMDCPSVQYMNLAAFEDRWEERFEKIGKIKVPYSNFFFTDNGTLFHSRHILEVCKRKIQNNDSEVVTLEEDGYRSNQTSDALGYLFRVTFRGNITSVNPEGSIWINENICEPDKHDWYDILCPTVNNSEKVFASSPQEIKNYVLRLKIALLTQGVVIDKDAEQRIIETGGLRPATNNAIDLRIDIPNNRIFRGNAAKYLIVNAPVDIRFVDFSPFRIILLHKKEEETDYHYCITYYGQELIKIRDPYPIDPVALVRTQKNGKVVLRDNYTKQEIGKESIPYSEVAFLSTDRLRVHLTNKCIFKTHDAAGNYQGCAFCNIEPSSGVIDLKNVDEVVAAYCERSAEIGLTHFLIGGQTAPDDDSNNIIEIIKIIRRHARYAPIYAMTIPYSETTIRNMYEAGLNQISFNIEVFNDKLARKYMPGKRSTTKDVYLSRLRYATRLFGRRGGVRTMVIVGLESHKSFIEGIEAFTEAGIQPILSIFRPLPGTLLADMQAPPMKYLVKIYDEVLKLCKGRGFYPGPDCVNCQNNTLALPVWLEEACK